MLKFLSNDLRVSIVAAGTTDALIVMQTDPQIASRFESYGLPSWTVSEDLRSFVAGFFTQLKLNPKEIVNNQAPLDYILELTAGVTGRIVELLRLTARPAIRAGRNTLTVEDLQDAGKKVSIDLTSVRSYPK